jgi:hypothetical protein
VIGDVTLGKCVPLAPVSNYVRIDRRITISSTSKPRACRAKSSPRGEEDEAVSLF